MLCIILGGMFEGDFRMMNVYLSGPHTLSRTLVWQCSHQCLMGSPICMANIQFTVLILQLSAYYQGLTSINSYTIIALSICNNETIIFFLVIEMKFLISTLVCGFYFLVFELYYFKQELLYFYFRI